MSSLSWFARSLCTSGASGHGRGEVHAGVQFKSFVEFIVLGDRHFDVLVMVSVIFSLLRLAGIGDVPCIPYICYICFSRY